MKKMVFIMLSVFALQLSAKITIVSETTDHINNKKSKAITYFVGGKVKVEVKDTTGKIAMIVRDDQKKFYQVKYKDKTYTVITEKDKAAMVAKQKQAMAQMEAQLKNLPPAQRDMIKKQMGAMYSAQTVEPKKKTFKKMKAGKSGKWSCTWYGVYEGKAKVQELCTIPHSKTGITTNDLNKFFNIFKRVNPFGKIDLKDEIKNFKKYGFPVVTKAYQNGKLFNTQTVKSIKKGKINQSQFNVPKGFKKVDLGM